MQNLLTKRCFIYIIAIIAISTQSSAQSEFEFSIQMPDEIGYLEELFLPFIFKYNGKKKRDILNPLGDALKFSIGISSEDILYRVSIDYPGLYIQDDDDNILSTSAKISVSNDFEINRTLRLNFPSELKNRDAEEVNKKYIIPPGNYILKLEYQPYDKRGSDKDYKNRIIIEKEFEVVDYSQSYEKQAVDWLLNRDNSYTIFYSSMCDTDDESRKKGISEIATFLEKFPNSRFAPFGYLSISKLLINQALSEKESDISRLNLYSKVINYYQNYTQKYSDINNQYIRNYMNYLHEMALQQSYILESK